MGSGIEKRELAEVRRFIAAALLEDTQRVSVGSVTLKHHQASALARIRRAIEEFGGALLADDVGIGKTFVAAALMKEARKPLVVVPSVLKGMWRDALARTEVAARVVTFERLSRAAIFSFDDELCEHDLVVVDEAHHARNARTRRYANLARLVSQSRVLLLTATPLHNRSNDLSALLGLFLGRRASGLTELERARCVLRRERSVLGAEVSIPNVLATVDHRVALDRSVVQSILDLPPPLPPRGGGVASTLVTRGLLHMAASSDSALRAGILKRIARAEAMIAALEEGTYPTARELESWSYAEGTLQLGFASLLADPACDIAPLLDSVRAHARALRAIQPLLPSAGASDAVRAQILRDICRANSAAHIVVFANYAETASGLFRLLVANGRVALLTGRGARVSGGVISRREVLERFAPRAHGAPRSGEADEVTLLITTDILSEGVNLQDASVVIHLDIPWTFARMSQRVGRLARIGSVHGEIQVHCFRPPLEIERTLRGEATIKHKWSLAANRIGSSAPMPFATEEPTNEAEPAPASSSTVLNERLRSILSSWKDKSKSAPGPDDGVFDSEPLIVTGSHAGKSGFLALAELQGKPLLLARVGNGVSTRLDDLLEAVEITGRLDDDYGAVVDPDHVATAIREARRWADAEIARTITGVSASESLSERKHLIHRVDSLVLRSSPHQRATRHDAVRMARRIVTTTWGAEKERRLKQLSHGSLSDDDWLAAVIDVARTAPASAVSSNARKPTAFRVRALVVFRAG